LLQVLARATVPQADDRISAGARGEQSAVRAERGRTRWPDATRIRGSPTRPESPRKLALPEFLHAGRLTRLPQLNGAVVMRDEDPGPVAVEYELADHRSRKHPVSEPILGLCVPAITFGIGAVQPPPRCAIGTRRRRAYAARLPDRNERTARRR